MNYRHIYHAGNFADIIKHIILTRIITYFKQKDKAFRIIDTHAGPGLYSLLSFQAQRTGEAKRGLHSFLSQIFSIEAQSLILPWRQAVEHFNSSFNSSTENLCCYPGSPNISRFLLRKQDRLTAIELHPEEFLKLQANFAGDHQTKTIKLNGWLALKAQLPSKERRTIVLVDPPFEESGEYRRLVSGLEQSYKRSETATYVLWYPIKYNEPYKEFLQSLAQTGIKKMYNVELFIRKFDKSAKESDKIKSAMPGCGMILVNPPYVLEAELGLLAPYLIKGLAQAEGAKISMYPLT